MRILVAGATGAIGRPLVPLLVAAGHEVLGTTRSDARAERLRSAGATPVVCDLLEPGRARALVAEHRPHVVIDQLTSLPDAFDPRRKDLFDANDRTRKEASGALIAAAAELGVRRYLLQSVAFLYKPEGGPIKDEDAPAWDDAPEPFVRAVRIVTANERAVLAAPFEGLVLRYGFFYGPGTWYESAGSTTREIRRRRFPVIGGGAGILSLVHVADAAAATAAAVERGASGIYNVTDDEPAPTRELLPALAQILGAKRPRRAPAWLARLIAGPYPVAVATVMRGASNAKAKRELGWRPALPSWREGLRDHRDDDPPLPPHSAPGA
jgi:nucleoside-diphosphate-sugar epimerase